MPEDIVLWLVVMLSVSGCGLALLLFLRQQKQRRVALLATISKLGSRNDLSFTGQEVLSDSVMGFDGLKKKLLVLENAQSVYRWYTINLDEVSTCTVQKTYRVPAVHAPGAPAISGYVERVELVFHCNDCKEPLAVPFYASEHNEAVELPALEARAHNWQRFLTKLLPAQEAGRA
ncbi:MAG TPA: hypothetical protein VGE66_00545 [Chitinophagaceae bacterium]